MFRVYEAQNDDNNMEYNACLDRITELQLLLEKEETRLFIIVDQLKKAKFADNDPNSFIENED